MRVAYLHLLNQVHLPEKHSLPREQRELLGFHETSEHPLVLIPFYRYPLV